EDRSERLGIVQAAIDVITAAINQAHLAAPAPSGRARAAGRRVTAAGANKAVSTPSPESCKDSSHELVQARRTFRFARLSPWQSERGLDPRGTGIDRAEGTGWVYLRGSCAMGGGQSGRALPAFSRPRRTVGRCGAARLRSIRGYAGTRLGRRPSGRLRGLRPRRQSLSPIRQERAGLLFRDVRGRHPTRGERGIAGRRRAGLRRIANRDRAACRHHPSAESSAGPDDGAAYLGHVTWYRIIIWAR